MASDIEVINLSDDEDEQDSRPASMASVNLKGSQIKTGENEINSTGIISSRAEDAMPSSSTQTHAANQNGIEKSKNELTLEMFLRGIKLVASNAEMIEANQITSNLKKRFNKCSEKFRNSNECYELISKFHNDVQISPAKKWEYCAKFKECLKSHIQVKPEAGNLTGETNTTALEDAQKAQIFVHLESLYKTLEKCMEKIKKLDETEVDLDDEKGSAFIIKRRYEERVIKIYEKINEYNEKVGNPAESLKIPHPKICLVGANGLKHNVINSAIDKFVNKKKFREEIQFPNYREICAIVRKTNAAANLNLTKEEVESYSKEAFVTVGQRIKKCRRMEVKKSLNDMIIDAPDDPADHDPELLKKLFNNRKLAEQRVTEVLDKFVEKSELNNEVEEELDSNAEENENEENDLGEEDEDDYELKSVNGDADENSSCFGSEDLETALENGEAEAERTKSDEERHYLEMLSDCDVASSGSDSERQIPMTNDEIAESNVQMCLEEEKCPMKKARLEVLAENNEDTFNPVIASVKSQVAGFSDSPIEVPERGVDPLGETVEIVENMVDKPKQIPSSTPLLPEPSSAPKRQQRARKTFPRPPSPDSTAGVECVILD